MTVHGSGHGATATRGSLLAQRALVVFQVTAAVLALFVAGLLGRTLQQLERIDTGFAADGLAIVELSWPETTFSAPERVAAFYDRLLTKLGALPDVVSAAPVNVVPFTGATGGWDGSFVAEGQPGKGPVFNLAVVGDCYFGTLGIRLIRGRTFEAPDWEGSAAVAIVSERAAEALWPGQDPLGKRLRFGGSHADWRTVVGVAAETRYRAIREAAPTVYLPMRQFVEVLGLVKTVAVRLRGPSRGLASVREAVVETDQGVSVLSVSALSDLVADNSRRPVSTRYSSGSLLREPCSWPSSVCTRYLPVSSGSAVANWRFDMRSARRRIASGRLYWVRRSRCVRSAWPWVWPPRSERRVCLAAFCTASRRTTPERWSVL